jgi:uncharacterized protein YmfQ (DUF2313 family)
MSFLSNLGLQEFLNQFLDLAPPGRAFSGDNDTMQATVFTPPANALANLHAGAMRLLEQEADPFYTIELLPEFETDYGLPDPCTPAGATIEQRRAALLAKIASVGGQSRAYFIGIAAALGYTITITEPRPFRFGSSRFGDGLRGPGWQFVWRVHAPQITIRYFRFGGSAFGERFAVASATDLQCRLNALKPARTLIQFIFA